MRAKRQGGRGLTLREYLRGEMKDPEFRRLYEEADIELRIALEVIRARQARHMTQRELAQAIKTKQQTVSRIERGAQNVTIGTLHRIARALGRSLQVRLIPAYGRIGALPETAAEKRARKRLATLGGMTPRFRAGRRRR